MNGTVLAGEGLSIGYTHRRGIIRVVFEPVDCGIRCGEMVNLIGPNGIGKSTLLRTLGGLLPPLGGVVRLGGRNIHEYNSIERAARLSLVLTDRVRVGSMRVRSLVALGRYPHTSWSGNLRREDTEAIEAALEMTGLSGLSGRYFSELSDGEKQKVMLARAIAQEPVVLILDEPTAYLDLPRRIEIVSILKKLTRNNNIAVLLSTHDLDLALKTADRLWILSRDSFVTGAPEDLVLNGCLEKAFSGHGLTFDSREGQFVTHEPHGTDIFLSGDGLESIWTRRALERDGYTVHFGPGEPGVRIETSPAGEVSWVLEAFGNSYNYGSILSLVDGLRDIVQP